MDFTCYGLIPLGVTAAYPDYYCWIALVYLEVTFFVNAAGLFFLSALIEKNTAAAKVYAEKNKKELTTLKMPPALIEGTESLILFGAIILWPELQLYFYCTFALGVTITVVQRLLWASKNVA